MDWYVYEDEVGVSSGDSGIDRCSCSCSIYIIIVCDVFLILTVFTLAPVRVGGRGLSVGR